MTEDAPREPGGEDVLPNRPTVEEVEAVLREGRVEYTRKLDEIRRRDRVVSTCRCPMCVVIGS
jgi:hypothetical protein